MHERHGFTLLPALAACLAACALGGAARAQVLSGDGTLQCGGAYEVSPGDSLSALAGRAYGDPQLYGFIADANWDALRGNPENIAVGMSLEIPCVDVMGQVVTPEAAAEQAASIEAVVAATGTLSPEQLDTLFGPVALFPDPVLSPLLVAVTFPLDVVKAARFVEETEALPDNERAAQAVEQPWDGSVRNLAAAFPDLVTRMNDHIDWTEQAGEAVIAQTDDVLDAIQRLRTKAQENGYLVDNETQTVATEGDVIVIQPANPSTIYVPVYDTQVVYTTPITSPPVYYYEDDYYGGDWDDAIIAGGIILGGAIILDEIFDDDDDWDGWNDWDDDIDVDWDGGDINIDRGDIDIDIDRDDIDIDRGDLGDRIDGDRIDGDRPGGDRVSIGDLDRPQIGTLPAGGGGRVGTGSGSISTDAARDAARQKIAAREVAGGGVANLPTTRPGTSRPSAGSLPTASRPSAGSLPSVSRPSAATRSTTTREARVTRPSAPRTPTATRTPSRSNTFNMPSGGSRPSVSAGRGRASAGGRAGGGRR